METVFFTPDHPIVLGLYGKALTGKTITGESIAPRDYIPDPNKNPIQWDHLFFALPLYKMATARQKIEGTAAKDRIRYEIHSALLEILGRSPLFGAPPYKELIELVEKISNIPMPDGEKPRTFLQEAGTLCRSWNEDCFVNWVNRMVNNSFQFFKKEQQEIKAEEHVLDEYMPEKAFAGLGIVLSDIRYPNEAAYVRKARNSVLVELTASDEVRQQRAMRRDGHFLTEKQKNHSSETQTIPQDWFDASLDTSDLSVQEQVTAVLQIVNTKLKGLPTHESY